MTPERGSLESRLKTLLAEKKAAKGVDAAAFLKSSAAILALLGEIRNLPKDNVLFAFEIGTYCWALEAIASNSADPARRREYTARLVLAFRKAVDSTQFWGDERSKAFGRTMFNAMVACLYKAVKGSSADVGEGMLRRVAHPYLEILTMRADAYLDDVGFRKDPVTEPQREALFRNNGGKRIRMKAWPSVAEKAFGLLNRCLKADQSLVVPDELVAFLYRNRGRGEWLGFYCANAMVRSGRNEEARPLLVDIARKKPDEFWIWEHLAETFRESPEDALSCLCRALRCPIRNREIESATHMKIHRRLARVLSDMGDEETAARENAYAKGEAVSALDMRHCAEEGERADRLVFGGAKPTNYGRMTGRTHQKESSDCVRFEGRFILAPGKSFGFVKGAAIGDIFVPPPIAVKIKNNAQIAGMAARKEDRKKKRMSWCMISVL